jgi:serine/threonine-protein kinase
MPPRPAIPGYVLGRRLGGGPTCDVFAANDTFGKTVAVKVLKASHRDDADARLLLHREAEAGAAIRHRHVVAYRMACQDHDPPFVVMEYLAGESLRQRLDRQGPPPVAVAFGWIRQLAEGLAGIHSEGFVHGDVKPANGLVTGPGTVKLIDLGFARRPGDLGPWTDRGHVLGTANYLAPELIDCPPLDTPRADLFSLGVLAFELITGRLPYGGRSTAEVVRLRRHCQPADLASHHAVLPGRFVELIRELTSSHPDKRPTASETVSRLISLQIATLGRRAA